MKWHGQVYLNKRTARESMGRLLIKHKYAQLLFFIVLLLSPVSCALSPISFTVLDADTKKPIEGAAAIAFWDKTVGLGFTHTKTVRVVEEVTGEEGKFKISVPISPGADEGRLKIYKPGYVGWDSEKIYWGHYETRVTSVRLTKRDNFKWQNQTIYLEKFKKEYSFLSHNRFLSRGLPLGPNLSQVGETGVYRNAIRWEVPFATEEHKQYLKDIKKHNPPK